MGSNPQVTSPRPARSGRLRFEDVLTPRGQTLKRRLSVPVLVATVSVVPLLIFEDRFRDGPAWHWLVAANWLIWGVFAVELALMLWVTPRRWAYLRCAWLDVLIVVLTLPALPHLMAAMRLARLVRFASVLRLTRLTAVANHLRLAVGRLFGTAGLAYVLAILLALIIGGGPLFAHLEEGFSVSDGIWWAIVTSAGYGDVVPSAWPGRALATCLMVVGLASFALFTAAIAARIVDADDDKDHAELIRKLNEQQAENQEIKAQLRELNERLQRL